MSAALLCLIVAITDGDTMTARCGPPEAAQTIKIRVAEIDAPERRQPFGERSRQHLAELCFQQPAEVRQQTLDRYGRTVARVSCDGKDASAEQLRAGMAWAYRKYLTDGALIEVENEARAERRGLWADLEPVPPWDWRRRRAPARPQSKQ